MSKKRNRLQRAADNNTLTAQQAGRQTQRHPADPDAWLKLGQLQARQQDFEAAKTSLETAVELRPSHHGQEEWLGYIAHKQHRLQDALQHLKQAQSLAPESAFGLVTLSRLYLDLGGTSQALDYAQKAWQLDSKDLHVIDALASSLGASYRFDEAADTYDYLTTLAPHSHAPWNSAGNMRRELGMLDEAYRCYRKASKLAPNDAIAYSNHLTALHYDPRASHADIAEFARSWQRRFAPKANELPPRPTRSDKSYGRHLTIGLLSDGLRQHPVGKMIVSCLENLAASQITLVVYTTSDVNDLLTRRIRAKTQKWQPIRHLSDGELTQQIRDDEIDILIDLSGHNAGTRMRAIAMQPAPLIVKWVGGLINTTGVEAIDYLISDHIETPTGEDNYYTEKLIRLPDDYIVFDPPEKLPTLSELPAKRNGYITLACFNNPTKLNDVTLKQWASIMHELPDSRLMLKGRPYTSESFCERLYTTLEAEGIARERLIIEGPGSNYEMLDAYNRADIALDPWPYSGGLTTCESFIMGVPVVTLPGPTFAGRHSATHLVNAGMPELVVNSWEEYRARVIELASDLESLGTIRQHLRDVLLQSPVCDGPRFAQHFTDAMRAIWQRYCDDKAPAALTFNKEGEARFEDEDAPVEIHYAAPPEDNSTFQWQFEGKLIAVDNGGQLLNNDVIRQLLQREALELIAFDPSSRALEASLKQHKGVHYYPNVTLGDGQPSQLHACLDPKMSSSLKPLSDEYQPEAIRKSCQVLTRLPLSTITIDSIEGLPAIDWLVLDDLNDATAILDNGTQALKDTLLLQVKIAFQPTHERQPNFAELQHWASRNGFRFYRLHEPQHRSHLPEEVPEAQRQATELTSADALLLPSHERMEALSDNQRTRLAFLLHTVFGVKDVVYSLLENINEGNAQSYLYEEGMLALERQEKRVFENINDVITYLEKAKINPIKSNHSLPGHLVVSLTSYKARFNNLHLTLRSLLLQETQPDLLILWIAEHEKNDIPNNVWELEQYGLSVRFCEDLRSYKKIVPTLVEQPDSFIVTADDDIYYKPDWLQELVASWDGNYTTVTAHRAHKMLLDNKGGPAPYRSWKWQVGPEEVADGFIVPTGCGGVMYPPDVFHKDVTKPEIFMDLCPDADDIWLYWMASLNGAKAKRSDYNFQLIEWPNEVGTGLWQSNIYKNENDRKIQKMANRYGLKFSKENKAKENLTAKSFDIKKYWEGRYRHGGTSGAGSYGRLAIFKSEIINGFIKENSIKTMIEFGCGDGNQLSLLNKKVDYLGVDISESAIKICRNKFSEDINKRFLKLDDFKSLPENAEVTISLDVIYHLVDDNIFHDYMDTLFSHAHHYCIIYSADVNEKNNQPTCKEAPLQ